MDSIVKKYAPALLPIAIVVVTFLTSVGQRAITPGDLWQLAALVAGAVVTYLVPLSSGPWPGILKTGAAIVAAAAATAVPLVTQGHLTMQNWLIIALSAMSALATEIGVNIHKDTLDAGTYTPGVAVTGLPAQTGPVPVVQAPAVVLGAATVPATAPVASDVPVPVQSAVSSDVPVPVQVADAPTNITPPSA